MRAKAPASLRSVIAVACLVMPSGVLAVAQLELSLLPSRNQDFAQMVAFLQPDYRFLYDRARSRRLDDAVPSLGRARGADVWATTHG